MGDNQTGGPLNTTGDTPTKKKSKLRMLFKAAFALVAVLAVGTAVVFYLARSEPGYWKEHQKLLSETTPQQLKQLAGQVESELEALATLGLEDADTQATPGIVPQDGPTAIGDGQPGPENAATEKIKPEDIRIDQDQTFSLDNPQLAAVVQTRLDGWLADRGYVKPEEIRDPMIGVSNGGLVMAFQIQTDRFSQVVSGRFDLKIREDGYAELTMERFLIGSLPVPVNALGEHLRHSTGDDRAVKAGQWLEKLQYMEFKPVIELDHRRRARVQDYRLLEKGLELTVRVQDYKTYKAMNTALAGVPTD